MGKLQELIVQVLWLMLRGMLDNGFMQKLSGLKTYRLCSKSRWANMGQVGEKLFSCELLNVAS